VWLIDWVIVSQIQVLLGIKEGKRAQLEQKALKDMFMSMAKGDGGAPDLSALMGAFNGKDGQAMDPKALEEMMANMGGADAAAAGVRADLEKMSPEEMKDVTKGALQAVKESLRDGSITTKEIDELEAIMGVDLKSMVALMSSGKVDKSKLRQEFGSDMGDLLDIFQELAKIKDK
jgi:hypothetical protein